MAPSRRSLLQAVGIGGATTLAGCIGRLLPGGESTPPAYLDWLAPPGRLIDPGEYRVGVFRPTAIPDAGEHLRPFLPVSGVEAVDPTTVDRLVVGGGATVLTGTPSQETLVGAYRDAGYGYQHGYEEFWVLDDGNEQTPRVGVADGQLILAWPTARRSADAVIETLVSSYSSTTHWTTERPQLREFTAQLGTPPALVLDLGVDAAVTAPARGAFAESNAAAVVTDPSTQRRIYAVLLSGTGVTPDVFRTWATVALSELTNPTVSIEGRIATVTGRPTDTSRVQTRFPAAADRWNGTHAVAAGGSGLPDGSPPRAPVREQWRVQRPGAFRTSDPPAVAEHTVYATADDCYAIDARDGHVLWQAGLQDAAGTPVFAGESVVVAGVIDGSGAIVALDPETGNRQWVKRPPNGPIDTLVGDGDRVYVGTQSPTITRLPTVDSQTDLDAYDPDLWRSGKPGVLGLDAASGDQLWRRTKHGVAHLTATDDTVIAGGDDATGRASVSALDAGTGRLRWDASTSAPLAGLAVVSTADQVGPVVITTRESVRAKTLEKGSAEWQFHPDQERLVVGTAVSGTGVYVATEWPSGRLPDNADPGGLTRLDGADGTERWQWWTRRRPAHWPVVVGDVVHLVQSAGALTAFDAANGTMIRWGVYTTGDLGPPAVVGGSVYLHTDAAGLVALGTSWRPGPPTRFIRAHQG